MLLTFHGIQESHWPRCLQFVQRKLSAWRARHWCASMESCASRAPHCHLMLQFTSATHRQVDEFCFGKCRPNASTTDLCGEFAGNNGKGQLTGDTDSIKCIIWSFSMMVAMSADFHSVTHRHELSSFNFSTDAFNENASLAF